MADVALDLQNSNPKELFGQGVRAYVLQDYDTAVRAFSTSSELLAKEHEDDMHDSLGDVYLYYGKSLLELSRKESGPLGDGVLKNVEEGDESEEVEESEGEAEKSEANGDVNKTNDEKSEAKPEEVEDKKEEDKAEAEEPSSSSTEKKEEGGDAEEELTDLQVAWEVLELAKKIFIKRGADGRKNLAETLVVLGEVSLESGNFSSAIEDMNEGLQIQKTLFANDSRTVAETFYKLGGAYSTNAQIDEAIESFSKSLEYLENKIASLKKDEAGNQEEIEEISGLIPEIQEKIADMKNLKQEISKKVTSGDETAAKTNGNAEGAPSSSKQVNDISHLVKRKRKEDEPVAEETPAKKPSP